MAAGTLSSRSGWATQMGGSAVARPAETIRVTLAASIAASSAKKARCEAIRRLASKPEGGGGSCSRESA